jgi:hypothetical protein
MFLYSAYQFLIESPLLLNSLMPIEASGRPPDVQIELYAPGQSSLYENTLLLLGDSNVGIFAADDMLIVEPGIHFCRVTAGQRVIVQPTPGANEDEIAHFIQTTVLQFILHQRGYFVLHASAVEVNGAAAVFMAPSTGGKSTLAAFMSTLGYPIVADDLVALDFSEPDIRVIRASSNLRLWPDAVTYVGEDAAALPRVINAAQKRVFKVGHSDDGSAVPLGAVYALIIGPVLEIQPLSLQRAFQEITKDMMFSKLYQREYQTYKNEAAELLKRASKIVASASVARLQRPASLNLLPEVADLIIRDMTLKLSPP